jgi:16S rRNA (cytidine1402-2'-O)-methyltransferase
MSGKLYLVATPIGNLKDITIRAVETLQSVDIIACEDTRETLKLLNHLNIKKKMLSYFEHNKREKGEYIISLINEGNNVALVSDAGTPAISDPGEELVVLAIENGIDIVPIPGAVALTTALICSGLFTGRFVFEGFLPVNKRAKKDRIDEFKYEKRTVILYEAPHKILTTLKDLFLSLGERKIVLARELTKKFEEFKRTTLSEAIAYYEENSPRGEFVVLIEGTLDEAPQISKYGEENNLSCMSIKDKVMFLIDNGMDKKEAIKQVAKDMNMSKRDVYMECVEE